MGPEQSKREVEEPGALEARSVEEADVVDDSLHAAVLRRRRRAVLLFALLMSGCAVVRAVPMLYFYRSGYSCAAPQTVEAGGVGWSGSRHCGDADRVIGDAQRSRHGVSTVASSRWPESLHIAWRPPVKLLPVTVSEGGGTAPIFA